MVLAMVAFLACGVGATQASESASDDSRVRSDILAGLNHLYANLEELAREMRRERVLFGKREQAHWGNRIRSHYRLQEVLRPHSQRIPYSSESYERKIQRLRDRVANRHELIREMHQSLMEISGERDWYWNAMVNSLNVQEEILEDEVAVLSSLRAEGRKLFDRLKSEIERGNLVRLHLRRRLVETDWPELTDYASEEFSLRTMELEALRVDLREAERMRIAARARSCNRALSPENQEQPL